MKIDEMARLFNDRIDMHNRELAAFGANKADQIVPEHVRFYAEVYEAEVERMFKSMVPDKGSAYEINEDRLKAMAWQHNEFAWRRLDHALHAGYSALSGYVYARAETAAHREIAANFWALSEGSWMPDMGRRIPNR